MRRGNSSGGGQSSLGYLFGSGEAASASKTQNAPVQSHPANGGHTQNASFAPQPQPQPQPQPINREIPAGIHGNLTNNYHRADGQNSGNFITDRPSTKVHAAPGGGSSLGYLFGGPPGN